MQLFTQTTAMLQQGLKNGVYPGAVFSTGDRNGELYRFCCGNRMLYPEAIPMTFDTLFDMASLTKIFATTMIAFRLIDGGKLTLSNRISEFLNVPTDKRDITIWHLLTHTGGFPASARLDILTQTQHPIDTGHVVRSFHAPDTPDVLDVLLKMDLLYPPGTNVTYSCLGFILLGSLCALVGGHPLDELAQRLVFQPLKLNNTGYRPIVYRSDAGGPLNIAATEYDAETDRYWQGIVHDENARFLSGVSGNAGVFSNLDDCVTFALMLANHGISHNNKVNIDTANNTTPNNDKTSENAINGNTFISRALFEESITSQTESLSESRGLGFALSSCALGLQSFGHTGFTGTSLWVDTETGQYAILLTNRVHPTRTNNQLLTFRHAFHALCTAEYRKSFGAVPTQ